MLFHEKGFLTKSKVWLLTLKGPFSNNKANSDEQPGPPVSQIVKGSYDGLDLESNNQ